MESIVMATLTGAPMADGNVSAGNGMDNNTGGLFGMLVDAALAGGDISGKKIKSKELANPLAALLMASLLQGRGNAASEGADPAQPVRQTAQAGGQPKADVTALFGLLSQNEGAGQALTQLFASQGRPGNSLPALLGATGQGNADLEGIIQDAAAKGENAFPALLEAVTGKAGGDTPTGTQAPISENGMQALQEIKALFIELIGASHSAAVKKDSAEAAAQPEAGQAQPGAAAPKSAHGAPAFVKAVLDCIDGLAEGSAVAETVRAGAVAGADTGTAAAEGGEPENEGDGDAMQLSADSVEDLPAAPKESKKETAGFHAALRAFHADAASAAVGASAAVAASAAGTAGAAHPTDKSAAMALRHGSEAFDSIVDTITSMNNTQQKDMEIRLKPDFLGHVVIKLSMDEGGLVARIAASNPKVQDAFISQVSSLQNSLAEQGLKDVRIVVTPSFVQDASLQQQQAEGRGQWRQGRQKRMQDAVGPLEGVSANSPALVYEMPYRTGTIDRLA